MNESNINRSSDILEIDLWKLLLLYLRRWRLILLCALAAAVISLIYTANFITPLYRANVTIYVNNIKANQQVDYISAANLATSQQLVNTYVNIIRSDTVLEKVVKNAKLDYSAAEIRGMMTTAQVDETELFSVYISHPDPEMAAKIANAVATVAPGEIEEFVEGSSTKIIDHEPLYPKLSEKYPFGLRGGSASRGRLCHAAVSDGRSHQERGRPDAAFRPAHAGADPLLCGK